MKRIWSFLLLLCSTAVFLMACSDNQAAEAVVPTEPPRPTSAITATAMPDVTNSNLSQIGQTKQPQLLNAYASW